MNSRTCLHIATALLLLLSSAALRAQKKSSKRMVFLPVPTIGHSPETGTYLGAVCQLGFPAAGGERSSNAKVELTVTTRKQLILESGWTLFSKAEKWYSSGLFHISKFPDRYWSSDSNTASYVRYGSNRVMADITLGRNVGDKLFAGVRWRLSDFKKIDYISGDSGAFREIAPALSSGAGLTLRKDSRDNLLNPRSGMLLEVSAVPHVLNPSVLKDWFNPDSYIKTWIELRRYKTWKDKRTAAFRILNEYSFGTAPFYDLALLGGEKNARGYYLGRQRFNNQLSVQGEIRQALRKRFGFTLFAGISAMYNDAVPTADNWYPNAGLGLRFKADRKENINLRLDAAIGTQGNYGFYIAFGEAF